MTKPVMGVYVIQNMMNGMVYIGATTDLRRRSGQHRRWLPSNAMEMDRWLLGPHIFETILIEEVTDPTLLAEREQWWLSLLLAECPEKVYNHEKKVKVSFRRWAAIGVV